MRMITEATDHEYRQSGRVSYFHITPSKNQKKPQTNSSALYGRPFDLSLIFFFVLVSKHAFSWDLIRCFDVSLIFHANRQRGCRSLSGRAARPGLPQSRLPAESGRAKRRRAIVPQRREARRSRPGVLRAKVRLPGVAIGPSASPSGKIIDH